MTDLEREPQPGGLPADGELPSGGLVAAPWGVRSALGLVVVAFVITVLAGVMVAAMRESGWGSIAQTLVAGGILLGMYAALLGIVWGVSARGGVRFAEAVGLRSATGLRWYAAALGAAVVGCLFSVAFTGTLTALGFKLPREDLAIFRVLPGGPLGVAITVLLVVVVAPLAEEVVFRGVLLSAVSNRWGMVAGLAMSTAVFSAVHLSLVGFGPLLVAGGLFGWLFIKSRSLRVAIVAHAAYNAIGVIVILTSKASGVL